MAKVFGRMSVNRSMGMQHTFLRAGLARGAALWVAVAALSASVGAQAAAWVVVASEPGKRVEVDRDSVEQGADGATAKGRVVLDKPIVDPRTSSGYRIIEIFNRFDCAGRTYATLKRAYYKDENDLVRQEEVRSPFDMPVRSGTPDDRMMREVCRPAGITASPPATGRAIDKVNALAAELRPANDAMVERAVQKELTRARGRTPSASRPASKARETAPVAWAYTGPGGPENWGRLKAEYAQCGNGFRQAPIDLREGIAVDLETPQFDYRPVAFRVEDRGRWLQVLPFGGGFSLLGRTYALENVRLVRPAETLLEGRQAPLEAQLLHRAADGATAIVSVLFDAGTENRFVQGALNDLPLEPLGSVQPPGRALDPADLLPGGRRYYTFLGSLSTPPCSEDVLWLVFKQTQQVSNEQLSILQRLYPPNARPVQPANGRIVKESR